jgi:hypothetical protein
LAGIHDMVTDSPLAAAKQIMKGTIGEDWFYGMFD